MEIVLRAAAIYFFLWVVTKAMGKRELSQMSPFELILLVTMGDLIQQAVTQDDRSVTGGVLAVSTLAVIIIVMSYVTYKSSRAREVLEGIPTIVVHRGEPLTEALEAERLTLDEVRNAAREQGVDDLRNVKVGILEADGRFSFLTDDSTESQQGVNQERDLS
jgi:uncharacterized membrane protein YcaP (DUF421 family)